MPDTPPIAPAIPAAIPVESIVVDWAVDQCPICLRQIKKPKKVKPLYGLRVCHKCRNAFANRRQLAFLIDGALYQVLALGFLGIVGWLATGGAAPAPAFGIVISLMAWIALPLVFCLKDAAHGRSIGKRLMGVQVVDEFSREPIGTAQSLKRNLILLIPYVGVIGGAITMMKGKRWGEGWAKTRIVWLKYKHRPPFAPAGRYCRECGYDLTGNVSGQCPECGKEIPRSVELEASLTPSPSS